MVSGSRAHGMVSVSVPFRGFRGLQGHPAGRVRGADPGVSVPFRGFRGLQVHGGYADNTDDSEFQSPSGVLGVCGSGDGVCRPHTLCASFSPLPGF